MYKQIILSGAASTGKTTALNRFIELYKPTIPIYKEIIRHMVIDNNIKVNADGDTQSQNKIFDAYKDILKYDFISDRGLLDVVVYTIWLNKNGKVDDKTTNRQLTSLALWCASNPDVQFIFFPPLINLVDDGFRDTNVINRNELNNIYIDLFEELKTKNLIKDVYIMKETDLDERAKIINKFYTNE